MKSMDTAFTKMFGISLPIIGAPMFLVSNPELVVTVSQGGGIGAFPALNYRTTGAFQNAIKSIKTQTQKPFAVNLIVNKANPRMKADLQVCVEEKVPLVITSLGNPKEVIDQMHAVGSFVFCDVVHLEVAKKVQDYGCDGVIAVASGAGGHPGPLSSFVLLPYLRRHLSIPIVAAGGIATGQQILAALVLGADAVQIGTRFIATTEATVDGAYKKAIITSAPEDIVLTKKISGTPASVINTPYVKKQGLELSWIESQLLSYPFTKKYMKMFVSYLGSKTLENAVVGTTWKEVWSAGQGVGLIDSVLPAGEVLKTLEKEFQQAFEALVEPQKMRQEQ